MKIIFKRFEKKFIRIMCGMFLMAGIIYSPVFDNMSVCSAESDTVKASETQITGRNVGKKCRVHYRGTFNDGTQFDSSYDRGETLDFVCGAGMMIKGFDAAVADMEVGQETDIHLMPEEAYGPYNPQAVFQAKIANVSGSENLHVGDRVILRDSENRPLPVKVVDKTEETITFDANHEMAGKELNFHIQLVEVL